MLPVAVRSAYARAKARALLKEMAIPGPPVPVEEILRRHNILWEYAFDLEAPTTVKYRGRYIILIPPSKSERRDRWSFGHEFAHVYLGHFKIYPVNRIVRGQAIDLLGEKEFYILDRECDIFVSELLMPKEWVYSAVKSPVLTMREVGELKDLFLVSWEAMLNRLDELKIAVEGRAVLHRDVLLRSRKKF
ncbi:ImmA/IrrE family metallo-endopeptidase [Desulfofundulus sp.]|uniref:ImmA/IrrE family metallo-endopeptidase n=1 Tax=Desulfofundulus sp. TaxID=2282750 RepID=UPI003C70CC3A